MAVLIEGMEMPKKPAIFCIHPTGTVYSEGGKYTAIFVQPHGELIDRDKLRAKEFIHDGDAYAVVMSRDIRNAPTIIPAEEGET